MSGDERVSSGQVHHLVITGVPKPHQWPGIPPCFHASAGIRSALCCSFNRSRIQVLFLVFSFPKVE